MCWGGVTQPRVQAAEMIAIKQVNLRLRTDHHPRLRRNTFCLASPCRSRTLCARACLSAAAVSERYSEPHWDARQLCRARRTSSRTKSLASPLGEARAEGREGCVRTPSVTPKQNCRNVNSSALTGSSPAQPFNGSTANGVGACTDDRACAAAALSSPHTGMRAAGTHGRVCVLSCEAVERTVWYAERLMTAIRVLMTAITVMITAIRVQITAIMVLMTAITAGGADGLVRRKHQRVAQFLNPHLRSAARAKPYSRARAQHTHTHTQSAPHAQHEAVPGEQYGQSVMPQRSATPHGAQTAAGNQ